jgi:hypothetical protein
MTNSMENHLTKLLDLYPNENWNMYELATNPNITIDIVKKHPKYKIKISNMSGNPNIDWDYIHTNPNIDWNGISLGYNSNLTIGNIMESNNLLITQNHNIGLLTSIIKENKDKYDYLKKLLIHPLDIPWNVIEDNLNRPWNYEEISTYDNITLDIVKHNPDINCIFNNLSRNSHITLDIIKSHPEIHWDYSTYSFNPNVSLSEFENNPKFPWNMYGIMSREFITMPIILKNWKSFKNMRELGINPNLTWQFIRDTKDEAIWDFNIISYNKFNAHPKVRDRIIKEINKDIEESHKTIPLELISEITQYV